MTPLLTTSRFYEEGVMTPEEFVKAGDQLVASCATWQWYVYMYPWCHVIITSSKPVRVDETTLPAFWKNVQILSHITQTCLFLP